MLYNAGQAYHRAKVSDDGDRCEWFSFSPAAIAEACASYDPSVRDRLDRPFIDAHAPVDARTYALQRRVVEHVTRSDAVDPLFVEEASLRVLGSIVAAAYGARGHRSASTSSATERAHADIVVAVKSLLAKRTTERLSLSSIAQALGRSPFHVARVFARQAGMGVHAYRNQLRLRVSLERVAAGDDLTGVALDLGFSSHSHFTTAFARAFGQSPSAFRTTASKNVKAARRLDRAR
jgi:AraC-like DNA-binding protein